MVSLPVMDQALSVPVAVIDDDPKTRTRLALQLGEQVRPSAFASIEALEERGAPGPAFVAILGPSMSRTEHMRHVPRLRRGRNVAVVMVADQLTTELLQLAMRAGVADVVPMPLEQGALREAVGRAAEGLETLPALGGPAPAATAPDGPLGRVVTVASPKGGAGKSVVSANLAVALAKDNGPVALVDADLQFGDLAVMLQLAPKQTMTNVLSVIDRLDAGLLRGFLQRHEMSGVFLLPAPTDPAQAEQVTWAHLQRVIAVLRTFCTHVVVDTPPSFSDIVLGLFEESDDLVLVAGMDVPHIKNTKIALQTLRLLGVPNEKVTLLLNRANAKVKLDVAEVERVLGRRADCAVPSDIAVVQSVNKGIPIVIDAPRSGVTRSIQRLAALFAAPVAARA